jgi:hypothetical protein
MEEKITDLNENLGNKHWELQVQINPLLKKYLKYSSFLNNIWQLRKK